MQCRSWPVLGAFLLLAACSGAVETTGDTAGTGGGAAGASATGSTSGTGGSSGSGTGSSTTTGSTATTGSGSGTGGASGATGTTGASGATGVGGASGARPDGGLGGAGPDAGGGGGTGGGIGDGGVPSSGCGKPWMPADVEMEPARAGRPAMQVVRRTIDVNAVMREYLVAVPQGYDSSKKYVLVFGFHGSGGTREQLRGYMNVEAPANGEAIFIYPSGLPPDREWGLAQDSPDLVLVDKLLEQYSGELCVDQKRIFATGHSFGGCFSNAVGCFRGGVIRAIAPVAGCGQGSNARCTGKIATLQIHSPKDTQVRYNTAVRLCTGWIRANGCDDMPACGCDSTQQEPPPAMVCMQQAQMPYMTSVPIEVTAQDEKPPVLRAYMNCDPGYPSVFIDHWRREKTMVGDPTERWHNPPRPWTAPVVWEFFKNLPYVN